MMAPVSVCHQLSWMGWSKTLVPQMTASGFSGSPTLLMCRSVERLKRPGQFASPAFISMRTAVGAVYHTVTLVLLDLSWYHALAPKPPS